MSNLFLDGNGAYDVLGNVNNFREISELYIKNIVESGKWFTVCHKIDDKQEDIMKIQNSNGETLGQIISNVYQEGVYRTSIYKYLLSNFLCYVEIPTVSFRNDNGIRQTTFDKMLVTSNLDVVAEWLDCPLNALPDKYAVKLDSIYMDDGSDELPYLKLTSSKDGVHKVSCPRKNLDVSQMGTRVIPLFMLMAGVDALYSKMTEGIVKVSFLKDGGQIRDIFTSVDKYLIKGIYGSGDFYNVATTQSYTGWFLQNENITRGYIRVPEIGGSRYDNPMRSINYARIISLDYNAEPDLSFIDIDLSTVIDSFTEGVERHISSIPSIIESLKDYNLDEGSWEGEFPKYPVKNLQTLVEWVYAKDLVLSTVFKRDLCLFMLANPQWFSNFTGEPKMSSMSSIGIE